MTFAGQNQAMETRRARARASRGLPDHCQSQRDDGVSGGVFVGRLRKSGSSTANSARYIGGDHRIAGVTKDVGAARLKVKPEGVLVFNDYSLWDCTREGDPPATYGVVQCQYGWRMLGFTLQRMMFGDVALVRG